MAQKISRLTIDLPPSLHKKLKAAASLMGSSMRNLIVEVVTEYLQRNMKKITMDEEGNDFLQKLEPIQKIVEKSLN